MKISHTNISVQSNALLDATNAARPSHYPPVTIARFALQNISLSFLLAAAGCSPHSKANTSTLSTLPEQASFPATEDFPLQIRATGRVIPSASVAIKSQVDGELEEALFKEGHDLKPGETIVVIDSKVPESAIRQAEANLQRDQAYVASAEADAHQNETLFNQGVGPAELAEQSRAAAEAARATVAADTVALENARLQLQLCRITSPIGGRAGRLLVDVGNTVRKQRTVIATINQTHPAYVDFLIPEAQLAVIQKQMENGELDVTAVIPGQVKPCTGKLLFVDNAADPATSMIPLRARFANDDETLWPGETVEVTLTLPGNNHNLASRP